jgi:DHA2 family multidrug resistance protein-like MFS transporter
MVVAPVAGYLVERIHAGVMGAVGLCVMSCGLFLLAFLPSGVSMSGICLRMVLCGLGFGIFQSPNNSTMIGSAPQQRSGSASGMLATARLTGQTVGASLVALLFFLSPVHGTQSALVLAGLVAILGASISGLRLTQKMPRRA